MEKYIILVDCGAECIDLHCELSGTENCFTAQITDGFHSEMIITDRIKNICYAKSASYILDKGRVISIVPLEKNSGNFFRTYIRIEEINRHLSRLKKDW
jgi:urate oxidase